MKKKNRFVFISLSKSSQIQLVKVHATSKHAPCKLQVSGFTLINVLLPGLWKQWATPER